eukprot:m.18905 g.18905  ORF g.18905 m.18905 type:complete len:57 (-) comp7961_c0_seq1:30-200(-)
MRYVRAAFMPPFNITNPGSMIRIIPSLAIASYVMRTLCCLTRYFRLSQWLLVRCGI